MAPPRRSRPFAWPRKGTTQAQAGFRLGFRSGLEEANQDHLKALGVAAEYETLQVIYAVPTKLHTYHPDFRLPNGIIVETKGRFLSQDRAKHLFVRAQYPTLDIRMVFTRSATKLEGGSGTYADWCRKHGILYADKLVPSSWCKEPGPAESPEAVLRRGPEGYREIFETRKPPKAGRSGGQR